MPARLIILSVACFVCATGATRSGDSLSPDTEIAAAIDHYVSRSLESQEIVAAGIAADSTILRRTTLDLAGRIPTPAEQTWFRNLPAETRRATLVGRLLGLTDFRLHLRNELATLLLAAKPDDKEFREYLLWAVQQNRSWDTMFRDMLLPESHEEPRRGARQFLLARINQLDDLTNDTAVLFFGVNISCAKCHDHPLVEDWQQDHFYGMQSFFSRTYKTKKNGLAEKLYDEVKFRTADGKDRTAEYMFLAGDVIQNRTPEFDDQQRKDADRKVSDARKNDDATVPVPEFSPRRELVAAALRDEEEMYFARNIVNRIWARLMGTGIVEPPDQMHRGNPPSHPELLQWLARDLRSHGYDLQRLIRGIVLSNTYVRSSTRDGDGDSPEDQAFAVGKIQALTPIQLGVSLLVATESPDKWRPVSDQADWDDRRTKLESRAGSWMREFEQPGENFQIAVDEALFFSNSSRIQDDLLRPSGDRIIGHLERVADNDEAIDRLWRTLLAREPLPEESETARELMEVSADRVDALKQLAWALLTGPEFRFNH